MKKIILCGVVLIVVLLCFYMNRGERKEQAAIEYVEAKYGQNFALVTDENFSRHKTVRCRPRGMDKTEYVTVTLNGYHDNYFGFLMRKDVEDTVRELVSPEFPECKVYYDVGEKAFPDRLNRESTFRDFQRTGDDRRLLVTVCAKANGGNYPDLIEKSEKRMMATGQAYFFRVYVVDTADYDSINRNTQGNVPCVYEYERVWGSDESDGTV